MTIFSYSGPEILDQKDPQMPDHSYFGASWFIVIRFEENLSTLGFPETLRVTACCYLRTGSIYNNVNSYLTTVTSIKLPYSERSPQNFY